MHDHGIGEKRKLSWDEKIQEGVSLYFEGAVDDGSIDVRDINPEWSSRCELHPKYRSKPYFCASGGSIFLQYFIDG